MPRPARQRLSLPEGRTLKAVVMPHAGYIYSGWTAAHAGHVLRDQHYAKVVVMAPDHRVGFRNAMISDVDAYQTPLGRIRLHADAHRLRAANNLFGFNHLSDSREHSLEVVLPFLQHYLDNFELVPIVMGPSDARRMAGAIAPHLGSDTLLVVSSDLSHYLPYDEAVAYDRRTLELITGFEAESLGRRENCACGKFPLQVLLTLAQRLDWRAGSAAFTPTAGIRPVTKDGSWGMRPWLFMVMRTAMPPQAPNRHFVRTKGRFWLIWPAGQSRTPFGMVPTDLRKYRHPQLRPS